MTYWISLLIRAKVTLGAVYTRCLQVGINLIICTYTTLSGTRLYLLGRYLFLLGGSYVTGSQLRTIC